MIWWMEMARVIGGPGLSALALSRKTAQGTYIGRWIGESLNLAGEVGESEYGENADIKDPFGDAIMGDFNAMTAVKVCALSLRRALARHLMTCVEICRA